MKKKNVKIIVLVSVGLMITDRKIGWSLCGLV